VDVGQPEVTTGESVSEFSEDKVIDGQAWPSAVKRGQAPLGSVDLQWAEKPNVFSFHFLLGQTVKMWRPTATQANKWHFTWKKFH